MRRANRHLLTYWPGLVLNSMLIIVEDSSKEGSRQAGQEWIDEPRDENLRKHHLSWWQEEVVSFGSTCFPQSVWCTCKCAFWALCSLDFQWNSEFVRGLCFKPNVMLGKIAYGQREPYRCLTWPQTRCLIQDYWSGQVLGLTQPTLKSILLLQILTLDLIDIEDQHKTMNFRVHEETHVS